MEYATCHNQGSTNKVWPETTKSSYNKSNLNKNSIIVANNGTKRGYSNGKSETRVFHYNSRKIPITSTQKYKEKNQKKLILEEAFKK